MSELDLGRELDELASRIVFPPTPDLAPAVLARIRERRRPRRLALAFASAMLAVLAAAAVLVTSPGARSTVLDWLQIGGVEFRRADRLPKVPVRAEPVFGERVTLEEARRRVEFPVLVPERLGEPDRVHHRPYPSGGAITLVWGDPGEPRLALTEWAGRVVEPVLLKVIPPGTRADVVTVGGGTGVWLAGAPHVIFVHPPGGGEHAEELYLAGNVLVWEVGERSFRIEAAIGRDEALRIARSLR
jgi:hypothetical protein